MKHIEGNFEAVRSINSYYQAWLPEGEVKAVLLVVHGMGEHCGRYANVVDHFVPLGYAVYGFDLIGHGKSDGEREIVEHFDDYTDSLVIFYRMVKEWRPGAPVFVLGHSLGGEIIAYYLLDHHEEFKGAIISAPLVKVGEGVSPVTIAVGKALSKIAPKIGVLALDASFLSRDPKVVEAYVNDPLVFHEKTPARLGAEMISAMTRITAEASRITLPMIIVQGGDDLLVDPSGAQFLFDEAGSTDKTLKIYDGMYHEVLNEPDRERVLKDVEDWLEAHLN